MIAPLWLLKESKIVWQQVIQPALSTDPPQEIHLRRPWGTLICERNTLEHLGYNVHVEGLNLRRLSINIEIEPCENQ